MTNPPQNPPHADPQPPDPSAHGGWRQLRSRVQLLAALALTVGMLAYLLLAPTASAPSVNEDETLVEVVQRAGPGVLRILPGTALEKKLDIVTVAPTRINSPLLTVTGTVVASLRPGPQKGMDQWQFNAPEVLTAYTDWQKAVADITFNESQLERVRELSETRVAAQKKVVARLQKLVDAGTDSPKDLAVEQTNLLQYQIQGRKEIYEAETAVRVAKRSEAALSRQLQQAGLEPEMLRKAPADVDIVMADVPESVLTIVKIGQGCRATFFGLPGETFPGKVNGIAPVLSKDRRSLRVLFQIMDPRDQLRPGMFAEIGLGTDSREALLMPAEGLVHIGRADYVLVAGTEPSTWRITEVRVAEPQQGLVEVQSGLRTNDRVIGKGSLLLKPPMVRALLADGERSTP